MSIAGNPYDRYGPRLSPKDMEAFFVQEVDDYKGVADGGGYKRSMDDKRKVRVSLVPGALTRAAGRACEHGQIKYAAHNWRRGMSFSEVLSAMERHLLAIKDGEMIDPDSGLHHLDHIAANTAFLAEYIEREEYAQFNDLFVRGEAK